MSNKPSNHYTSRLLAKVFDIKIAEIASYYLLDFFLINVDRIVEVQILSHIVTVLVFIVYDSSFQFFADGSLGKKIFNIHLISKEEENHKIPFQKILYRSVYVCCFGLGLLLPKISILFALFTFYYLYRNGTTHWDKILKLRPVYKPISYGRMVWIAVCFLFLLSSYFQILRNYF
ncbi:RDD family protein [Leptospira terpstrae]|uniref:RDD family protein n=1 Tax=Leptospira terpstrae serovar Hualin str. LT 11-33 = ATCC 700639 TaxID=1257025 RepID=N1VR29_9LEPT|nr:RDD family protein [Leptospira terpstrae]EMY62184.1 RDD family protein [Leptospira terpstrae serovar Hualin str. LT 11-33 = ATCC 700639]